TVTSPSTTAPPTTTTTVTSPSTTAPPRTTTSITVPCRTARCTLDSALISPRCMGQSVPASVTGKLRRAENLIEQAETSPAKKARKLRQRARHLLKAAGASAKHAAKGKKAKLSAACAGALEDAAGSVAADL